MSRRIRTWTKRMGLSMAIGLAATATTAGLANASEEEGAAEADAVHETIAGAAGAALAHLDRTRNTRTGRQLMTGAIVRAGDGYAWQRPVRVDASRRPVARLAVDPAQVATYVVQPRTGQRDVDRANDRVSRAQRRLVDELDPLHRPLFVLTPSGRVLAYHHGAPVVELALQPPASPAAGERLRAARD